MKVPAKVVNMAIIIRGRVTSDACRAIIAVVNILLLICGSSEKHKKGTVKTDLPWFRGKEMAAVNRSLLR